MEEPGARSRSRSRSRSSSLEAQPAPRRRARRQSRRRGPSPPTRSRRTSRGRSPSSESRRSASRPAPISPPRPSPPPAPAPAGQPQPQGPAVEEFTREQSTKINGQIITISSQVVNSTLESVLPKILQRLAALEAAQRNSTEGSGLTPAQSQTLTGLTEQVHSLSQAVLMLGQRPQREPEDIDIEGAVAAGHRHALRTGVFDIDQQRLFSALQAVRARSAVSTNSLLEEAASGGQRLEAAQQRSVGLFGGGAHAHAEGGSATVNLMMCPRCFGTSNGREGDTCPKPACGGPTLITTRNISMATGGAAPPGAG